MIHSIQPKQPVPLTIDEWIQMNGETFDYVDLSTIPIGSLFYEPQGGYVYSPYHVDDGYSIICDVVALVDSTHTVQPVMPGSTYMLDKRLKIIPLKDSIRFMSRLWKTFYDSNTFQVIGEFSFLVAEKDRQIAELRSITNEQTEALKQLSSCDPATTI